MTTARATQEARDALEIRGQRASAIWNAENAYYWFSDPARLGKALAQYELYRTVTGLPGAVVELGVYKATSLVRLATFRALLETETARRIIAFDAFGSFPREGVALESDRAFIERFEGAGGEGLSVEEVRAILDAKPFGNVELVPGNVLETLPRRLEAEPALRIALLHLDMDVKEPTAAALELMWDRVVPGGVVMIDDYGAVGGATEAIDAFVARAGVPLEATPLNHVPAFLRKPGGPGRPGTDGAGRLSPPAP
jgi:hypothetical protein